uniref:Uncharacterized protein n=1 Tax=Panagrolaimus davidi TaxID=227884 RepID=A0A914QMC8_9BILA
MLNFKPSPQQNSQQRDSPTPDLLRVKKFPVETLNGEPLSPTIIREQCDEIYRIVQNHSLQIYPPNFDGGGPESGYNTLKVGFWNF